MAVLLGQDSSLIVGPQLPLLVDGVRKLVAAHNAGPVRFVVVTPADSAPDYADGGWGQNGAVVLAQENLRARMRRVRGPDEGAAPAVSSHTALPVMGFSEVVQLYVSSNSVHAIHHDPGYSDADLIVHFETANVVYLGNTFTANGYPAIRIDRGGSIAGMIKTVEFFTRFPQDTRFIPGRGALATKDDLMAYFEMLTGVRDRVQRLIDAGKTEQQAVAAHPTASFDAKWGRGPVHPDAFVSMVYRSLSAH